MATPPLCLYYWPSSSASQKALMVLEEANLPFKRCIVNIGEGEQNTAWYLRINPAGQVPVLQIGDKYVADSEAIYDAVLLLVGGRSTLIPDLSTPEGKLVEQWRKRFTSEVDVFTLTFGTIANPELADGPLGIPKMYMVTREGHSKKMAAVVLKLESLKAKNPDLSDVIDKKIALHRSMGAPDALTAEKVETVKQSLDKLFDDVESQLRKSRTEHIVEHWLCGANFTVCDITLIMLIGRLKMLNSVDRYVNAERRPALVEYWAAACRRDSVKKIVLAAASNAIKYFVARKAKRVALGSVTAGAVVALAVFVAHKYRS